MNKSKFSSNILVILVIILLGGNIYFALRYIDSIKKEKEIRTTQTGVLSNQTQTIAFLSLFVNSVFINKTAISSADRINLESGIIQLQDPALTAEWKTFEATKDAKSSQAEALKILSMLIAKLK